MHRRYQEGLLPKRPVPAPKYPREIPALVKRTVQEGRCVECHLIADLESVQRELDGTVDKLTHLYRAPEIKKIGIALDIPRGLRVKRVSGSVGAARMRAGDVVRALNGTPVWTFGDLQWEYGRVEHSTTSIQLGVERDGELVELDVLLLEFWWHTDLTYRNLSVDPRIYFRSDPLTPGERAMLGFEPDGFASRVLSVDALAELLRSHQLQVGDIVYGVDGTTRDEVADTADLYIKLRKRAGSEVLLQVLRGVERLELSLKTERMSFRK